ncbi:Retrovirus-related Pol polyprotein from transposon TNT 1-94 [Glycine max]|nr:Retrovirus-related Pol polyprotein from transposon TNT 1-94 [Glycine max]
MALEERKVNIEKVDGRDFNFWKMQIEDFLYQKKLYQPLSGDKPDDVRQEEWNLLDRQALGVIRLTLAKKVVFNIVTKKTTASVMKALSDMYEKSSTANKVYLMRRLFNLKMGEGNSITDHINEFNIILVQLELVQIKFEDEVKALILLSSLLDSWAATVTIVSSSTRENTLKLSDIRDLILSKDVCKRDSRESSSHVSNSALNTEGRGRTTQKVQNGQDKSKSRGNGQTKFRSDIICWNCDKRGHFTNQCKAPKKNKTHKKIRSASFHTTPSKDLLSNYISGRFGKVYLADGKSFDIVARGDIDIKTSSGSLWTLHNVIHIPALERNLISIGQLDDEGHYTTFGDGAWKVTKDNLVVARGKKRGSLYMIADEDMVAVIEAVDNSTLWHQRLGYMSEKRMKLMTAKGNLSSPKHVDVGVYEHCIFGKQKKVSFSRTGKTPKGGGYTRG